MINLRDTNRQNRDNLKFYNRKSRTNTLRTAIGIISKINESKFTVDVFMPITASQLTNVTIANNFISQSSVSLKMLPEVGQKVILLMSAQHPPLLIATIPNSAPQDRDNKLLSGEFKLGTRDAFVKLSKDKTLSSRTLNSITVLSCDGEKKIADSSAVKGSGFSSESSFNESAQEGFRRDVFFSTNRVNYFKEKKDLVSGGDIIPSEKSSIINQNMKLLDMMNSLIYSVSNTNDEIELGSLKSIEKLDELQEKISRHYNMNNDKSKITIDVGATKDNEDLGVSLSMRIFKDSLEKSSLLFGKDGTITLSCKDFIVERGELNE